MSIERTLRIMRISEVSDRTGLSRTTITELEKKNLFPKRVPLTKHTNGYVEAEVDDWLHYRKKLRDLNDPRLLADDSVLNADLKRGAA